MVDDKNKIGVIGLGRMGGAMVEHLIECGYEVVGYNRTASVVDEFVKKGMIPSYSIKELVEKLPEKKVIWLMVNAGKLVDDMISELIPLVKKDDIIIDGGNSWYKDSQRRYNSLKLISINYLDIGTSGGIEGARHGACMMIGGDEEIFRRIEHFIKAMCTQEGYGYMGKSGAGHFVKGIHNAIEYGMMGAIVEGMDAIKKHEDEFGTDMKKVAKVYAHGSIVQSRLVDWMDTGMNREYFEEISGSVPKGETEEEMEKFEKMHAMNILHEARLMRIESRQTSNYMGKLLAVIRNEFGGHKFEKK